VYAHNPVLNRVFGSRVKDFRRIGSRVGVTLIDPVSNLVFVMFSAGKITREDRTRLHGDTVKVSVLAQALKKKLI